MACCPLAPSFELWPTATAWLAKEREMACARLDLGSAELAAGIHAEQARPPAETSVGATYADHQQELVRFARSRVRDPEAAQDVVQEAFLRLVSVTAAGGMPDEPIPWLRRVIANIVVSDARRRAVAGRWEPWLRARTEHEPSPEVALLIRERDLLVQGAVKALPLTAQRSLVMAAHGYSSREIARAVRRSESASRTMICRARVKVREELRSRDVR
jgi:RNA polymerase sigma factor (sigma-70 family)